jgi:hypothetical protein
MLDGFEIFLNPLYIVNENQNIPVGNGNQLPNLILDDMSPGNVVNAENFGIENVDISFFQEVNSIDKLKK